MFFDASYHFLEQMRFSSSSPAAQSNKLVCGMQNELNRLPLLVRQNILRSKARIERTEAVGALIRERNHAPLLLQSFAGSQ